MIAFSVLPKFASLRCIVISIAIIKERAAHLAVLKMDEPRAHAKMKEANHKQNLILLGAFELIMGGFMCVSGAFVVKSRIKVRVYW